MLIIFGIKAFFSKINFSHKSPRLSYLILEVRRMNERAIKGIVVDAGHPSLDKPNVIVVSCSK